MVRDSILIVDDDAAMRFMLSEALGKDGYEIVTVSNALEAIDKVKSHAFSTIIMDIKMPKMNGLDALFEINRFRPNISSIVLTAYGIEQVDLKVIKECVFAYFTKPFDLDKLRLTVKQAIEKYKLYQNKDYLYKLPYKEIIGESAVMREVREFIVKVSETPVTVLIQGESGTGKELVARAVHFCSPRKNKPFIPITCSAIPESLLESELFGYVKGAFTDAKESKPGKFELANEGTIFLDELADMSPSLQAKLLRVLEQREVEVLGAVNLVKVDVRVVAATNKDLYTEVKAKRFREDLYYRLNVASLTLPPLRQRKGDIPLLLEHFIGKFNKKFNRNIKKLSVDALESLINYHWPGNVRELENIIQRLMLLDTGLILTRESLNSCLKDFKDKDIGENPVLMDPACPVSLKEALKQVTNKAEKDIIKHCLIKHGMNRNLTCKELKI
ncbi:MAG: sigma-54 dependent transcriptional regulator, partial [Candidatus Omnitrophica bacterium]|nr:sigma-54 dependent transcriptional regulator [Candidatus Omnitrophota bacterium]